MRKVYSRKELDELKDNLYKINLRSVPYELGKVTEEMENEEYPKLLGVHHYPELKEVDFISEEKRLS